MLPFNQFRIPEDSADAEKFKPKRRKKKSPFTYESDAILTLDIEVSSAWLDADGNLIPYEPGHSDAFWNRKTPVCLPYIWQFSYNSETYYGHFFDKEFPEILRQLDKDTHYIIWVHNLSYEFHFLNNFLKPWDKVFARAPHKPIYAISELFPNVEFRCSYMLTRLSLDSWGKSLGFPKLHTLEYTKMRTPLTPLSDEELAYAKRDCQVVYKGIQVYRKRYGHLYQIPMTQTGEVRKVLKERIIKDRYTYKRVRDLIPRNSYMYGVFKRVFCGGYTHANYIHAGHIFRGLGSAWDFASSYPFVMCSEKFPITPFVKDIYEPEKTEEYAYIMCVRLEGVRAKTFNHYIPCARCMTLFDADRDNGRVINASDLTIWITEIDLDIIQRTYNIDKITIGECYRSKKGYLPKIMISYILELYSQKTTLKGVKGMEDIYQQSKSRINSTFGMCVTDLVQDEIVFDGEEWSTNFKSLKDIDDYLDDLRENNKGRSFLAYQWGAYVTAYARRNLWDCLLTCDENVIYCDTDSLKINTVDVDFDWYNLRAENKLKRMCQILNIDFNLCAPLDPKGKPHPLGRFEREHNFTEFKTLGAKRYVYRDAEDGNLHLTVAGINKEAVAVLKDNIDNFTEDISFDKDDPSVHKMYVSYISAMPDVIWKEGTPEEYHSTWRDGIAMRPTGYTMSLGVEYASLIGLLGIIPQDHLYAAGAQASLFDESIFDYGANFNIVNTSKN